MLAGVDAQAARLDTDQLDTLFLDKVVEHADGVGAAADTGQHCIWQPSLGGQQLLFCLFANHLLELTYYGREGVWTGRGAQQVVAGLVAA